MPLDLGDLNDYVRRYVADVNTDMLFQSPPIFDRLQRAEPPQNYLGLAGPMVTGIPVVTTSAVGPDQAYWLTPPHFRFSAVGPDHPEPSRHEPPKSKPLLVEFPTDRKIRFADG